MKDPLTQGSKGPILLPDKQEPFDPHHPNNNYNHYWYFN